MNALKLDHELKCWQQPFQDIWDGIKKAEFRCIKDREFKAKQIVSLREWLPHSNRYEGRIIYVRITQVQTGFGIPDDFVMFSFEVMYKDDGI